MRPVGLRWSEHVVNSALALTTPDQNCCRGGTSSRSRSTSSWLAKACDSQSKRSRKGRGTRLRCAERRFPITKAASWCFTAIALCCLLERSNA